jgi:hypothetical protein
LQGREDYAAVTPWRDALNNLPHEQAVGQQRQVGATLLRRHDREVDGIGEQVVRDRGVLDRAVDAPPVRALATRCDNLSRDRQATLDVHDDYAGIVEYPATRS